MKILIAIRRFVRDFPRLFVATCLSLLILSAIGVHAATSYDVADEPQMFLDASINTTATTIVLSSPQVNGANHLFSTTSGAVLRIRSGFFREDIYAPSASVNTTTNKVTLTNVIRNLCPYTGHSFVSCGSGRSWGRGAIVELTVDKNLLNLKANKDRANVFTASGAVAFAGSGTLRVPVFASTTERDRQITSPKNGMIVYSVADGVLFQYIGGAWTNFASGTTSNATETTTGKSELASVADQLSRTAVGDSGGPLVLQPQYLALSGSVAAYNGRIPVLFRKGTLTGSLLGTGNFQSGSMVLFGSGSWNKLPTLATQFDTLHVNVVDSPEMNGSTGDISFNKVYPMPSAKWTSGSILNIKATITCAIPPTETVRVLVKVGSVVVGTGSYVIDANGGYQQGAFIVDYSVIPLTLGTSGTVDAYGTFDANFPGTESGHLVKGLWNALHATSNLSTATLPLTLNTTISNNIQVVLSPLDGDMSSSFCTLHRLIVLLEP